MSTKMILLKSSDGESFEIEEAVALQSQMIAYMVEDGCGEKEIRLANVNGSILSMVIKYCKKHVNSDSSSDESKKELKKWDADFMKMDLSVVFDVMLAASYLNIKTLLHLTCQTVADMIPGKTPDEIRALFNIDKDLTDEEEAEIRRENQWAFE